LTVKKIPTDKFSRSLERILREAGVVEGSGSAAEAIDLLNDNSKEAEFLRKFNVNIVYTIEMPAGITEATAGDVSGAIDGTSVSFDLLEVMENQAPIVVKSSQLNTSYVIIAAAIVVLAGLAMLFRGSKKKRRKK